MRSLPVAVALIVAVSLALGSSLLAPACACTGLGGGPDAGFLAAEGEGEGGGEGEAGEGEGEFCSPTPVLGIAVVVKDGITDFPICDATVTITEGAYVETLRADGEGADCQYVGAEDRPGSYTVQATHPDYAQPATFPAPVDVESDACGHAVLSRVELELA